MLPIVLVLLVAGTVLTAPSVNINQYSINDIAPTPDNGRLVNSFLSDGTFEIADGGDTNVYILTAEQIINDLSNRPDPLSQTLGVIQTIAVVGELATGIPGDSCDASALINAYANYLQTGNGAGVRPALNNYIKKLNNSIDLIVKLSTNPNSVRYSTGPTGNCVGGGRSYQFQAAWNSVLNSVGPNQSGLVYEEYCATNRLYSAFNSRSNNVGAAITASSIAPVRQAAQQALPALATFLRTVSNGSNPAGAAAQAKQALTNAANNVAF